MVTPQDRGGANDNEEEEDIRRMSHMLTPPRRRLEDRYEEVPSRGAGMIRKPSAVLLTTSADKGVESSTSKQTELDSKVNMYIESQQQQLNALDLEENNNSSSRRGGLSPRKAATPLGGSIRWFQRKNSKLVVASPIPKNLPAPPSRRQLQVDDDDDEEEQMKPPKETVAVFNANTPNGKALVRGLSTSDCQIVAIVRVFTSKNAKELLEMPNVTVKVADLLDEKAVTRALEDVDRAFLCLQHWEEFVSKLEENQAQVVLKACAVNGVAHLVFATFEDTKQLRKKGLKSQIVPDPKGRIQPKFTKMRPIRKEAATLGVSLTHMITSYLDQEKSKKCLCLIRGANGKLIVQPHFQDV